MTLPANIRINLNAPFPALVQGAGPIGIGKLNGVWTVSFNTFQLGVQNPPPIGNWNTDYLVTYDSINNQFINIPFGSIFAGSFAMRFVSKSVNFNSANTDTQIPIVLPPGIARYAIQGIRINNASASISTATCGVFTAAAGGGVAIATTQAITITQTATDTLNNTMILTINNSPTTAYNDTTLFFRISNAQGSAATADVIVNIIPLS